MLFSFHDTCAETKRKKQEKRLGVILPNAGYSRQAFHTGTKRPGYPSSESALSGCATMQACTHEDLKQQKGKHKHTQIVPKVCKHYMPEAAAESGGPYCRRRCK